MDRHPSYASARIVGRAILNKTGGKGMIISASRRSDIAAFHTEWFMEQVRKGFVDVRNPYNARQVSRIPLDPESVDVFVFWTRNPLPLLPYMDELEARGYRSAFLVTVMDYPRELEPATPRVPEAVEALARLFERVGKYRIAWRYDPILLSSITPASFHEEAFSRLSEQIAPYVSRCIVSVFDPYWQALKRLKLLQSLGFRLFDRNEEQQALAELLPQMASVSSRLGLEIQSCCEGDRLAPWIRPGACIDPLFLQKAFGRTFPSAKARGQRLGCLCAGSKDIGTYGTCRHGCLYCYAGRL